MALAESRQERAIIWWSGEQRAGAEKKSLREVLAKTRRLLHI